MAIPPVVAVPEAKDCKVAPTGQGLVARFHAPPAGAQPGIQLLSFITDRAVGTDSVGQVAQVLGAVEPHEAELLHPLASVSTTHICTPTAYPGALVTPPVLLIALLIAVVKSAPVK